MTTVRDHNAILSCILSSTSRADRGGCFTPILVSTPCPHLLAERGTAVVDGGERV